MSKKYKPQIFISYSHDDEDFKDKLEKKLDVLQRQGNFDVWTDRDIGEGDEWLPEIEERLNSCDVAILLISDNFLTSDFITDKEVPLFLDRRENHGLKLYPLIIDDTPWKKIDWLAKLAGAMKDNIPVLEDKEQVGKKLTDLVNRIDDYCQQCSSTKADATDESRPKKPFNVPFESKEDGAIGIEDKLKEVDIALKDRRSHKANIGQVAAFQGMGGLGKTQLAVEYAHRYKDDYDGVVWLTVDQDIDRQIVELAESVGWVAKEVDAKVKLDISQEKYAELENILLIYDNVESHEQIKPLIPKANDNKILITSRSVMQGFTSIELATLSKENSLKLLEHESHRKITDDEKESIDTLIVELDGLPLALEMAGAYMYDADLSWNDYWKIFQKQKVSFLEDSTIIGSGTNHEANIGKTLAIGEELLQKIPLLKNIIHLLAFGASEPMSKELLSKMLGVEEAEVAVAIQNGTKLKFIKKEDEDGTVLYTLHRLVREVWKAQQELENVFILKVSKNLASYLKDIKDEFLNLNKLEMASFQAKVWADRLEDNIEIKAVLMCYAVYPEYYMGEYREALKSVDFAYKIIKDREDSDEYAEILNSIGFLLQAIGKAERAKPYQIKALEMRKRLYLTANHPDVALSLNNIGALLNTLGDKKGSKLYLEKAIDMYEQLYENKKNSGLARSFINMGVALRDYGDEKEIKYYYKKAIDILEQLYKNMDHPLLALSLDNMGTALSSPKDKKKSKLYQNKALEMRKRLYSDRDHSDMALSLYNVGTTLLDFKQCIQAKDNFLKAEEMIARLGYDDNNLISNIVYYLGRVKDAMKKEKKIKNYKNKGRFCNDT